MGLWLPRRLFPLSAFLLAARRDCQVPDFNAVHPDVFRWFLASSRSFDLGDLDSCAVVLDYLTKHRVVGRCRCVEAVQLGVVDHIDEELTASRMGLLLVSHGQGEMSIGQLRALIRNVAFLIALHVLEGNQVAERRIWLRTTLSNMLKFLAARILGVRAANLSHEVIDHTVEVQSVVESLLGQVNKVRDRDRALVQKKLGLHDTKACVHDCYWIAWVADPIFPVRLREANTRILHFTVSLHLAPHTLYSVHTTLDSVRFLLLQCTMYWHFLQAFLHLWDDQSCGTDDQEAEHPKSHHLPRIGVRAGSVWE